MLTAFAMLSCAASGANERGLGRSLTTAEVRAIDRDVDAQGRGLPEGSGSTRRGAVVFAARCAACHAHGSGLETVADRYPYATTLFDYIRRAMPPDRVRTPSADDVYALTAFILSAEHALPSDTVLDRASLPNVRMPAKNDFVRDDGGAMP